MGIVLPPLDVPEQHGLWEWHISAWNAWCVVSGQWRTIGLSTMETAKVIWVGLDYAAAAAGLAFAGIAMTQDLWEEVRSIEAGAVEELNKSGR